ncbi:LysR family transcriptional regulator [Clostridium sp. MCC353]|uniref:LysR family transcriptional regulator n=1 Tax=Clostridium sp. MCC353 TaxID=2592646 RepID=UPI001C02DDD9|nr:LysR family transcriptional regulator [Clostridium sp. MCC353]MBT9776765.1 LysR family transcriptional regulator [Clostridium sp. MCC353]
MDTRIIEYMIAISEEKSLSKAAEKLYISQPALSQQLKKLETELGTPLFTREKNSLILTDAGRVYINGGQSILHIKQEALKQLDHMNYTSRNFIRFGYTPVNAIECLPAFRTEFPDIEISTRQFSTPEAKEALIQGSLDIAVVLTSSLQHGSLEFLPLCRDELLLALPAGHPAVKEEHPFKDGYSRLAGDYFILDPTGTYTRNIEDRALNSMGIQPKILCETNDYTTERYMLNRGLSCCFIPRFSLHAEDTFRTYPLDPPQPFYVAAAYSKNIILSEPLKYLLRLLLNLFDRNTGN